VDDPDTTIDRARRLGAKILVEPTDIPEVGRFGVLEDPTGAVLAVMSQVPPGFTRALAARIEARRPGLGLRVHYWVETLIFGMALERFLRPERVIVGAAEPARPLPAELAEGLARFGCPVLPMRYESAELTKTAINLYLFGAVTYANTLADLCEEVGADLAEMVPALRLDKRIGAHAYIRPSLGVAGGNLERDLVTLRALCAAHGVDAAYIETLIRQRGLSPGAARRRLAHTRIRRRGVGPRLQEGHAPELDVAPGDRDLAPRRHPRLRPLRAPPTSTSA
jgi:UDPglucose 6-dehydrogenase